VLLLLLLVVSQEVLTDDKPRFSISGWYHAAAPPKGADQASLKQLQEGPGGSDAVTSHTDFAGEGYCG
jgi:hypothetical protein